VFEIGSVVIVHDPGQTYDCWEDLARKMQLMKWKKGKCPIKNNEYIVCDLQLDGCDKSYYIYGIEGGEGAYIMHEDGLTRTGKMISLDQSLLKIPPLLFNVNNLV
jgi:hypothetical protein